MAKEFLKGKNKLNTTRERTGNVVFGATTANPLENAEVTFDFIENVADVVADGMDLGDFVTTDDVQTISGAKTFSADVALSEVVSTPATSATYTVKGKQLVHTVVGGATEVIPINIPVGARIIGVQLIVSTVLVFTTGTEATATWTTSTQDIGATGLAAKNSKLKSLYDASAESPIVAGAVETITLTADAGTLDTGVVVVTAWYEELSDLTNVA